MMNKLKMLTPFAVMFLVTGCVGGGMPGNNGTMGFNSGSSSPLNAVQSAVMNSLIQSMAGSVLNGQIGSQIPQADQSFRLQQLGGLVQSGVINQSQQWVNPQTGNTIAVNPVGQSTIHPQTQQQCQNLQEVATLQNGQSITENRVACLDSQTGKWNLVQ